MNKLSSQQQDPSAAPSAGDGVQDLLHRPLEQRQREYRYRFAQTLVFGLPVLALHFLGSHMGGEETERQRWLGILQLILAGWIIYVGAAGMLFEGMLRLLHSGQWTADLLVAALALVIFLYSAVSVLHVLWDGRVWYQPLGFAWMVLLLAGWTGWKARALGRQAS